MNCPICNEQLTEYEPEANGNMPDGSPWKWYAGRYVCPNHGQLRISGKITPEGERTHDCWYPPCPEHGFYPVVIEARGWKCIKCSRRFQVRGLKIVSANLVDHPQPQPQQPVTWMDLARVEVGR